MNWIGEGVNILAQCLLFFGTWILHRTGLRELKLNRR